MASVFKVQLPKWEKPLEKADESNVGKIGIPLPPAMRCFEACGEWIENSLMAAEYVRSKKEGTSGQKGASSKQSPSPEGSPTGAQRRKKRAGGVKLSEEDFAEDWYDMLKLEDQDGASEEAIRNAYRKRCLETHPDKQPNNSDVEFKRVQRAFEILGDPDTRSAYDSSRPFDDTIPGEDVPEDKFYKVFSPVFERNKKWSVNDGLPSIGDDNTALDQVQKFYDAWYRYRSWRDFSHEVELEEIDEGMMREEKRYYQRENQRLLDKCMKEEIKRIRSLVDRAYKSDPRLLKKRAAEQAEQDRIRAEREAERERLRLEEERRRTEQSEKERREQEEKVAKAKAEKEAIKSLRGAIEAIFGERGLIDGVPTNMLLSKAVRTPNITWLASKSTSAQLEDYVREIAVKSFEPDSAKDEEGADAIEAVLCFNDIVKKKEEEVGTTRYGEAWKKATPAQGSPKHKDPHAVSSKKTEWSEDDLILLTKAIAKFPGGTVDRWRRIGTMLPPHKYSEEEILARTKDVERGWKQDAGSVKKQKAPSLGAQSIVDADTKSTSGTSATKQDAAALEEAAKDPRGRLVRMLEKYNPEKLCNVSKILETYKGKEEDLFTALVKKFGPEPLLNAPPRAKAPPTATSASKEEDDNEVEDWTMKQQKQLESGLRDLQGYKEKDKYVKIAAGVEGKTAKQCFERFKYLAALNKKK